MTQYSRPASFLPLGSKVATQDARYSRQESIEVHPFAPKGIFQQPDKQQFLPYFFLISFNSILLLSAIF